VLNRVATNERNAVNERCSISPVAQTPRSDKSLEIDEEIEEQLSVASEDLLKSEASAVRTAL